MGETYKGWKNRATWAVNLHMHNDHAVQDHFVNMALGIRVAAATHPRVLDGTWTRSQAAMFTLADRMKEYHEASLVHDRVTPDWGNAIELDLLTSALGTVEWSEIAVALLERLDELAKQPHY